MDSINYWMPKNSAKFEHGYPNEGAKWLSKIWTELPQWGCQMQVWWVKIGNSWQITHYNWKTVQDICIVSIKVEQEVVGAVSNGDISVVTLGHP